MPQDNQLSPLFGHMQDTSPADATPTPQEVSGKTSTILEGLSAAPATPESAPSESPFGTPVSSAPTTPIPDASPSVSEIIPTTPVPEPLFTTPTSVAEMTPATPTLLPEIEEPTLPEISLTPPETETPTPVDTVVSAEDLDRDIPLRIITPTAPAETPEENR